MAAMHEITTKLAPGGRVVIPAKFRRTLNLSPGDEVVLRLQDDQVRLYSRSQARKRAQDRVCKLVPPGVSLVEELLRDRRLETSRD